MQCDICLEPVPKGMGYALTTTQVVTEPGYWEYAFNHQWAYMGNWGKSQSIAGETIKTAEVLEQIVDQMSRNNTPWLVCDSCIEIFNVDKDLALAQAKRFTAEMPDGWEQITGSADYEQTLAVAQKAYSSVFGRSRKRKPKKNTESKSEQILDIEADSLAEARTQLKSQIPEGLRLRTQKIISNGKPATIVCNAENVEKAFEQASNKLPSSVTILEKKVLNSPESTKVVIEAFDETDAKMSAVYKIQELVLKKLYAVMGVENEKRYFALAKRDQEFVQVKGIMIKEPGKRGFLGIGKKPNSYEVEIAQQAIVEIKYKQKSRIRATLTRA